MELKIFRFNQLQVNTYLLIDESTRDAIIIDPGCQSDDEKALLKEYIEKNNIRLVRMLNTHLHFDHVYGNRFIEETYGIGAEGAKEDMFFLNHYTDLLALFDMPLDEDEKITAVSQLAIDTVERYQGSQRDIIIYGTTITQHYELEILSNLTTISSAVIDRKLNVAVTRARKQFFVLGNERLLRLNPIYESLIDYCTNVPSR